MTEIGEKGVNLSGGQKQRVSIARALYSDATFVILDDILAALDSHVQRVIMSNIVSDSKNRNKLVVFANHHLQFSEDFDLIVVLDKGSQVQCGSFGELLNDKDGLFSNLLKDYREEGDNDTTKLSDLPDEKKVKVAGVKEKEEKKEVTIWVIWQTMIFLFFFFSSVLFFVLR